MIDWSRLELPQIRLGRLPGLSVAELLLCCPPVDLHQYDVFRLLTR